MTLCPRTIRYQCVTWRKYWAPIGTVCQRSLWTFRAQIPTLKHVGTFGSMAAGRCSVSRKWCCLCTGWLKCVIKVWITLVARQVMAPKCSHTHGHEMCGTNCQPILLHLKHTASLLYYPSGNMWVKRRTKIARGICYVLNKILIPTCPLLWVLCETCPKVFALRIPLAQCGGYGC